jgi:hypothetical protein
LSRARRRTSISTRVVYGCWPYLLLKPVKPVQHWHFS